MLRVGGACGVAWLVGTSGLSGQQLEGWQISSNARVLGRGEDELFQAVRHGRIFPDGRAVVADAGALFLRVYGADGQRLAEIGQGGAGPGEFRAIHGIWLTPESDIGVWDGRLRRVSLFNSEGDLIATHPARADRDPTLATVEPFLGAFSDGSVLLAALRAERRPPPGEAVPGQWFLGRFSSEGELAAAMGELDGMWRTAHAPLPFSPVPQVAVLKDSIWTSVGFEDALEVRDAAGDVVRTIPLPWTAAPRGDPRSDLEARLRQEDKQFFVSLLDESRDIEGYPRVGGLLVDDHAQLWVKEYDPRNDSLWLKRNALHVGPGGTWRILTSGGAWVATAEIPDTFTPLDIRGGQVLGVELDALDVEKVVIRTIVR